MKVEEAKTKVCPFMSTGFAADTPELRNSGLIKVNCICDECMFWVNTVKGKKEIHRTKIPYGTHPMKEARLEESLIKDGYKAVRLEGEFRPTFIKYEESNEGYCSRLPQ